MKKSKLFAALTAAMLFTMLPMQVTAAQAPTEEEAEPLATDLIVSHSLRGYYGYNTLMVDASTIAYEEMAKIGIVDIVVQHSSDKITWVDEVDVADMINEDAYVFTLDGYGIPVISGYYYRIVVTHYAKEQGWFFPDKQEVERTSTPVWIG